MHSLVSRVCSRKNIGIALQHLGLNRIYLKTIEKQYKSYTNIACWLLEAGHLGLTKDYRGGVGWGVSEMESRVLINCMTTPPPLLYISIPENWVTPLTITPRTPITPSCEPSLQTKKFEWPLFSEFNMEWQSPPYHLPPPPNKFWSATQWQMKDISILIGDGGRVTKNTWVETKTT